MHLARLSSRSISPASAPLQVRIPGSKSFTNRALVLAALASGPSTLRGISQSDDSISMIQALRYLNVSIEERGNDLRVAGGVERIRPYTGELQVGPAGTTYRFLVSLLAAIPGTDVRLSGSERMHQRPIGDLVSALQSLGADISYIGQSDCPPLRIRGKRLRGGLVKVPGSMSSQYFTSLLLAAQLFSNGIEIAVIGEQISRSYIDMTLSSLKQFGIDVSNANYKSYTEPRQERFLGREVSIESDASGASYFFALAALSAREIHVGNLRTESTQGDARFPELLQRMGCTVRELHSTNGDWIAVQGPAQLKAIDVDMQLMPDTAQTLAVVCACAQGTSLLRGLSTLRIKETDRLAAMQAELAKCGIKAVASSDSLQIEGGNPSVAQISTYEDHRMAMCFAPLVMRTHNLVIEEPSVVSKSFPEYWDLLKETGLMNILMDSTHKA